MVAANFNCWYVGGPVFAALATLQRKIGVCIMALTKQLPPLEVLRKRFQYRDGSLFYKIKPARNISVGSRAGCVDGAGYEQVRINNQLYRSHRIIWKLFWGEDPGPVLDHIDGNPLNNKIENLQESDNSHNRRRSGPIGCVQNTHWGYEARIRHNGKKRYLGMHKTKETAQQAIYDYCDDNEIRYD